MGAKLLTLYARAGHEVVFSYARSKQKLMMLAKDAKGRQRMAHRMKPCRTLMQYC